MCFPPQSFMQLISREQQYERFIMDWIDNVTDEELNEMMDLVEAEDQMGGHLFDFHLVPTGPRRTWRNVADRRVFDAVLELRREPARQDDVGGTCVGFLVFSFSLVSFPHLVFSFFLRGTHAGLTSCGGRAHPRGPNPRASPPPPLRPPIRHRHLPPPLSVGPLHRGGVRE